jgi:hypothetical protein
MFEHFSVMVKSVQIAGISLERTDRLSYPGLRMEDGATIDNRSDYQSVPMPDQ